MRSFAVVAAVAGAAAATGDWSGHGGHDWASMGGDWSSAVGEWTSKAADWAPKGTGAPVYVTDVVTAYTTYCPEATQITHNGVTYTVTEATTLTISNCPCTVTRPVTSATATPSSAAPITTQAPPPPPPASTGAPPASKPSSYFPSMAAPSSAAPASSAPAQYTGAASKANVAGAGLLAVLGAAAAAL